MLKQCAFYVIGSCDVVILVYSDRICADGRYATLLLIAKAARLAKSRRFILIAGSGVAGQYRWFLLLQLFAGWRSVGYLSTR